MPHPPGRYAARIKEIPQGLLLREVQKALGIKTKGQASRVCARYRYKLRRPGNPIVTKSPRWKSVDWNMQDVAIAELMGCSRERVRVVRNKLGKPKAKDHGQRRGAAWDASFISSERAIRDAV